MEILLANLKKYQVILASASPRRQQLLKDLDINFSIQVKEVEEVYPKALQHSAITDFLADLKSKPFEGSIQENELVITSDTIVWVDGEALGKPKNYEEGLQMLTKLSNKVHQVITSVCITGKHYKKIVNDTVNVYFDELSEEEIEYYLKNYAPYDKAGAYGIQEWIGKIGIKKIEGSYFTVMGFPVHKLYKELKKI